MIQNDIAAIIPSYTNCYMAEMAIRTKVRRILYYYIEGSRAGGIVLLLLGQYFEWLKPAFL